jgi:glutamate-1-semialdehyde aminotransferase
MPVRIEPSNTALLTDAFHSALRAARGAAKRER